jgi:sec-independent protein translocase protein TatA
MGISGIGMTELLVILVIVMLLFGTKRLKTLGSDLGGAIKGFRSAISSGEAEEVDSTKQQEADQPPSANPPRPPLR